MIKIGLDVPKSRTVHNMDEAREALKEIGCPIIIRASYTLGGTGGGSPTTRKSLKRRSRTAWRSLPSTKSSWRNRFSLERVRDGSDARRG